MVIHRYNLWCVEDSNWIAVWGINLVTDHPTEGKTIDPTKTYVDQTKESTEADKKYQVKEYAGKRLQKETWYATDNQDETYSDRVEETVYAYSGNDLTGETVTYYFDNESISASATFNYYTNGSNVIKKRQ